MVAAAAAGSGFDLALVISAFALGFRHGIDWDHIAAITDITSSQDSPRKGLFFGTLYVLGHAMVVFVLGVIAIAAGTRLPASVDRVMGRVVGVTLILLGVYVFFSLFRYGRNFRMRSRWMLVFSGIQRGYLWASDRDHIRRHEHTELEHEHEHPAVEPHMHHNPAEEPGPTPSAGAAPSERRSRRARLHVHRHRHRLPSDPFANYGRATALGVGVLHGVGAETPTQILIFVAAAGAGGAGAGVAVLAVFLIGLVASNSLITLSSAYGLLAASKRFSVYATVAVITGLVSLAMGTLFLAGKETFLPALLGG